ncbi:MAG: hypothetical protein JRH20_31395 [Deltaproteobacteria bacterium]|nr:hypothetical protein [Deltaproteobacteria bacterium]
MFPRVAPPPRAGGALIAFEGAVYLVGGFQPRGSMSYVTPLWKRLDFDVWRYDLGSNSWTQIRAPTDAPTATYYPGNPIKLTVANRVLSWTYDVYSYGTVVDTITGNTTMPGMDEGTASTAGSPQEVLIRDQGFDPAWYEQTPLDSAAFAAKLSSLDANQWTKVSTGRHVRRDWGTTVIDRQRDQLLRWAGGHSSHNGTDVAHFSLHTGRWHILSTPELPFQYVYGNAGAPVPSLFGRPWSSHTYASVGVDQQLAKMISMRASAAFSQTAVGQFFIYDPGQYSWASGKTLPQFFPERHQSVVASTPDGVAVWGPRSHSIHSTGGPTGLWSGSLAGDDPLFTAVAGTETGDTVYPDSRYGDLQGMTYDSKRKRVLMFHFGITNKAHIWATDLATKNVTELVPSNAGTFISSVTFGREPVYIPDDDVVIVPTYDKDAKYTLLYDVANNKWREIEGVTDQLYDVNWGMRWDAKRKLLWGTTTHGDVYAMPFDKAGSTIKDL